MVHFEFKSNNNHFITSPEGTTLQVYEFTKHTIHPSSIRKIHWNPIATIHPENPTDHKQAYDGVTFPEDRGTIEGREALTMLARHLNGLQLLVSSEGYCFQEVSDLGMYSNFGVHYLRLNDLFNWQRYTIDRALTTNVNEYWRRLDLEYNDPISTPPVNHPTTKPIIIVGGGGVPSKENYSKLQRLVKEKDEELAKLKKEKKMEKDEAAKAQRIEELEKHNESLEDAIKAKEEELRKLIKSTNVDELHKQLKKKDDELQLLKKKMDDDEASKTQTIEELQKLNEDLEDAKKAKEEELQKLIKSNNVIELQKQLKKKDDELQLLKKKMDDDEASKTQKIEELEKLNEDLEDAKKAKEEELRKLSKSNNKDKNHELSVLEKSKNDTEATKKLEVEELMKLLEQSEKKSWSILVSTKFVLQSSEAKDKYLTTIRQKVPAGTFSLQSQVSSPFVSKSPMFMDKITLWSVERVKLVDEGSISIAQWPPLPNLVVFTGSGSVEDFDVNDWWYLKTTHPDGGLTMLVYYEGNRSQISNDGRPEESIIPLPFAKDAQVHSYHSKFSLFNMYPFGVRLGFTYRK
ncbi:hypothetical protein LINPERHAP1_LOCUS27230 [Linum perenne]